MTEIEEKALELRIMLANENCTCEEDGCRPSYCDTCNIMYYELRRAELDELTKDWRIEL